MVFWCEIYLGASEFAEFGTLSRLSELLPSTQINPIPDQL